MSQPAQWAIAAGVLSVTTSISVALIMWVWRSSKR